jgi:ubiquitin-protein ligase
MGLREYIICTLDGRRERVRLPADISWAAPLAAPRWLLRQLVPASCLTGDWYLRPIRPSLESQRTIDQPTALCIVRATTAAAGKAPFDPRQARLKTERLRLEKLNKESDYVRVEPIDVLEGSEPEHYRVTFLCRGIIGISPSQRPIYGDRHKVEIVCDHDFPSDVPRLRWITSIWHPNIQHTEPKGVCVNKPEWLGGMGLDDLCRLMFEMVQYKNYHATFTQPYPLDNEVAKWVIEYAEPHGIVDKKKKIYVDNKPFTRPTVTNFISVLAPPERPTPRIRIVSQPQDAHKSARIKATGISQPGANNAGEPRTGAPRIKVVKKE